MIFPYGFPKIDSDRSLQKMPSALYYEPYTKHLEFRFGFIAVNEELDPDLGSVQKGSETGVSRLNSIRRGIELPQATHEFMFDTIDAGWFMENTMAISKCDHREPKDRYQRSNYLEELLEGDQLAAITLCLSDRSEIEANYIENLQPSTWHLLVIGDDPGLPILVSQDYENIDPIVRRLIFAAPVLPEEESRLFEIFSLNHIADAWPDAGA